MTVNAIAVQYVRRVDPSSLLAALQIAELLLVISGSFNSVRRTDRSTELSENNNTSLFVPSYVQLVLPRFSLYDVSEE